MATMWGREGGRQRGQSADPKHVCMLAGFNIFHAMGPQ